MSERDGIQALTGAIERYNAAWNAHDVDAAMAMHAPDMIFQNHTAGEVAEGEEVRDRIAGIFAAWPDIDFATRRLYVRDVIPFEDGLIKRKDVYSDSVSILRQVGLLD